MTSKLGLLASCAALFAAGAAADSATAATPTAAVRIKHPVFNSQPASLERVQAVLRKAMPGVPPPSPPPAPAFGVTINKPVSDAAYLDLFNSDWVEYRAGLDGIASFQPNSADEPYVWVHWQGTQGSNYIVDCTVSASTPTVKIGGVDVKIDGQHALFVAKAAASVGTGGYSSFEIHAAGKKSGFAFVGCTFAPV